MALCEWTPRSPNSCSLTLSCLYCHLRPSESLQYEMNEEPLVLVEMVQGRGHEASLIPSRCQHEGTSPPPDLVSSAS